MRSTIAPKRTVLSLLLALTLLVSATAVIATPTSATTASATGEDHHRRGDNAELRAAMDSLIDAGATGAIALIDDGQHRTRIAVGSARLEPHRRLRVNDRVRVGSITKTMVATIVLQLVDEGRLSLDDTVEQWLPGVMPNGSAITIRMLLNMTSGIFSYDNDGGFIGSVFADPSRDWTPQELLDIANAHPPLFAPGEGSSYSNTGYILTGLILEEVTGRDVERLVKRRIVRPLRLRNTYMPTPTRIRGRHARGYFPPGLFGVSDYVDVTSWSPSWAWAAGAVVSNAPDLARFYQALLGGRLLSPAMLEEMTTLDEFGGRGLGLNKVDTPCGTVWGHDGGIPGYLSVAFTTSDGSHSTVFLMPTEPDPAISAAFGQASLTAICQMFNQPVPSAAGTAESTPMTSQSDVLLP